jgi:hypothetical protein
MILDWLKINTLIQDKEDSTGYDQCGGSEGKKCAQWPRQKHKSSYLLKTRERNS